MTSSRLWLKKKKRQGRRQITDSRTEKHKGAKPNTGLITSTENYSLNLNLFSTRRKILNLAWSLSLSLSTSLSLSLSPSITSCTLTLSPSHVSSWLLCQHTDAGWRFSHRPVRRWRIDAAQLRGRERSQETITKTQQIHDDRDEAVLRVRKTTFCFETKTWLFSSDKDSRMKRWNVFNKPTQSRRRLPNFFR